MVQPVIIQPFTTIPQNVEQEIERLLALPPDPAIGEWLYELIKASGHLSTGDAMQWRLLGMLWLAAEYDPDRAWPYLMWLNMNAPVMSDHLTEILTEALDDFKAYLRLARWRAEAQDERLKTFLSEFHSIPAPYKMGPIFTELLTQADRPELSLWLADYCRATAGHPSNYVRPWHLLAATWYATCFNPGEGLVYLKQLSQDQPGLPPTDTKILTELARELNCLTDIIGWITACPNPAVKKMLAEFGHPDLTDVVESIFKVEPDYSHLAEYTDHAPRDARIFERNRTLLTKAGLSPQASGVLDLACGPLATQALLLNSIGYQTTGVDLDIPPAYLPLTSFGQRFKRGKYVKVWQAASQPYYDRLAQATGITLNWKKLAIKLADLTRLDLPAGQFDAVICCGYLQHAPDVDSLLAEAARVLKSGGLLLADIVPYTSAYGAFQAGEPWEHLRQSSTKPAKTSRASHSLNRWRLDQYRTTVEKYFTLESWQIEPDEAAVARLTPDLQATLAAYSEAELTCRSVVILAGKK